MPSLNIKDYMLLALGLIIAGMWWSNSELETALDGMTMERDNALIKIGTHLANETTLKASISSQNVEIESLEIDRVKNVKELEEWKNKPPKVKYEVVYKEFKGASNDCNDTKIFLDSISDINFNSL